MRMYFVDLENINASGLEYIQSITKGDRYYVFYSDACSNISEEVIKRIIDNGASIKLCKVENGMGNALDFQLSTYMGYIIREDLHRVHEYIIVSGDKGYNVICKFWKEQPANSNVAGLSVDTNAASPEKVTSDPGVN